MTTTKLPDWERTLDEYGYLTSASGGNIFDPGYVLARLQESLRDAHANAVGIGANRDLAELIRLKMELERLARDLRFYTADGDAFLGTLQAVAPDLSWMRGGSFFADVRDESEAERHAVRLRLREGAACVGRRTWRGIHEGWPVTIYGPRVDDTPNGET